MKIQNEYLTLEVAPKGAEMTSICDNQGKEYLWQGLQPYWTSQAINLFPFVGTLHEKAYTYKGQTYHIKQHGFLRDQILEEHQDSPSSCTFSLQDSTTTKEVYPYSFDLKIQYELKENTVHVTYTITNTNEETMYFGLGAHPGFQVPLVEGESFEDYEIVFEEPRDIQRILYSEENLVTGETISYPLGSHNEIALHHDLFDHNIILLKNSGHTATLQHKEKKGPSIQVDYPDCPYIGFWHTVKSDAPFVCFEPWVSTPGREGVLEDITTMPHHISLEPNDTYQMHYSITIHE